MKFWSLIALLFLLSPVLNAQTLPDSDPVPGGIVVLDIGAADTPRPHAFYESQSVAVVKHKERWWAVAGIDLETDPGEYELYSVSPDGQQHTHKFRIVKKEYPAQYLRVKNKRHVVPNAEDLERIDREYTLVVEAFETWRDYPDLNLSLELPVFGRLSSRFGLRRFFNREPRRPHSGIDLAAPQGTPIKSPANGIVIRTGDFFFNGNTVFIDHGQGLISMMNHLHRIAVSEGQSISRGDIIGTVGSTGRVTGPHLHWTLSLNNNRVNPIYFLDKQIVASLPKKKGKVKDANAGSGK